MFFGGDLVVSFKMGDHKMNQQFLINTIGWNACELE